MIPEALISLAEDPEFDIAPPDGAQRVMDDRFCVVIGPDRRWAGVCRLRLPDSSAETAAAVAEIRDLTAGIDQVVWNVGSSATPTALPEQLRALGLRDPDPPMDPLIAAMALVEPPRGPTDAPGLEVQRITTLDEHLAGLEIMLAAADWPASAAADERARASDTFARRQRRGGYQWLALLDGTPVAFALADRGRAGLFLAGGSTLPEARGQGCYRALVHARWEEAVALGTPGLAVQAQYGSSFPILRRLGFVEVAQVHTLQ